MGLYPGFLHDSGTIALEGAVTDIELGGDLSVSVFWYIRRIMQSLWGRNPLLPDWRVFLAPGQCVYRSLFGNAPYKRQEPGQRNWKSGACKPRMDKKAVFLARSLWISCEFPLYLQPRSTKAKIGFHLPE